jgi:hypothetical protein
MEAERSRWRGEFGHLPNLKMDIENIDGDDDDDVM